MLADCAAPLVVVGSMSGDLRGIDVLHRHAIEEISRLTLDLQRVTKMV